MKPVGGKYEGVWINELKNGDIAYYINYRDEQGKPVKKKVGTQTKQSRFTVKDAYDRLIEVKHRINMGEELPFKNLRKDKLTLNKAFEEYIEYAKANKKSWKNDELNYNKHIKDYLGQKLLSKITSKEYEELKQIKIKEGLEAQTVKHILATVRQVINYCIKFDLVKNYVNPISKIKMPQVDNARLSFLTQEEAKKLLELLKIEKVKTSYYLSVFCLFTGARLSEVGNLRWQDINFDTNTIFFKKNKNGNERYVQISKPLYEIFEELIQTKVSQTSYLFFADRQKDTKTRMPDSFLNAVIQIRPDNNKVDDKYKITAHSLRHTHASWLAMAGLDIIHIKEQLGHKTLSMTMRYAHLIPNKRNTVTEEIGKLF